MALRARDREGQGVEVTTSGLTSHLKLSGSKQQPCIIPQTSMVRQALSLFEPPFCICSQLAACSCFSNGPSRTPWRSQLCSQWSHLSASRPALILKAAARREEKHAKPFSDSAWLARLVPSRLLATGSHQSAQIQGTGKWILPPDEKILKPHCKGLT